MFHRPISILWDGGNLFMVYTVNYKIIDLHLQMKFPQKFIRDGGPHNEDLPLRLSMSLILAKNKDK